MIVIAGDNLFDYDLQDYVDFWRGKGVASAVAVRDVGDLRLASQYGVVELDGDRVIAFEEKPADPTTTLCATATYIYHREHVPLVERFIAEGNAPDQSGSLIEWLRAREPVYGYRFTGVAGHRRPGAAARRRQHAPPRPGTAARALPARAVAIRSRSVTRA